MSIDGYLDRETPCKLTMSNAADFDRVDQLRAESDAIMVGASTVRRDDPHLMVRSEERRLLRLAAGRSCSPIKVTVTATGDLSPQAAFFTDGDVEKLVYCPQASARRIAAQARAARPPSSASARRCRWRDVVRDLGERGVRRLMVEGGGHLHTQFLVDELADELQLVIAPFFVGEPRAPRFVEAGRFPWTASRRARLAETRAIGMSCCCGTRSRTGSMAGRCRRVGLRVRLGGVPARAAVSGAMFEGAARDRRPLAARPGIRPRRSSRSRRSWSRRCFAGALAAGTPAALLALPVESIAVVVLLVALPTRWLRALVVAGVFAALVVARDRAGGARPRLRGDRRPGVQPHR